VIKKEGLQGNDALQVNTKISDLNLANATVHVLRRSTSAHMDKKSAVVGSISVYFCSEKCSSKSNLQLPQLLSSRSVFVLSSTSTSSKIHVFLVPPSL
jgi:hypothetical protein